MAKLKMLKLPKKPKRSSSITAKEKYLAKVEALKKENQRRTQLNNHAKRLDEKISGISGTYVMPNRFSVAITKKRKSSGTKKKAAKKSSKRRKR